MNSKIKKHQDLDKLKRTFSQIVSIPADEWEFIAPYFYERTFSKNEFIVRDGELLNNFYFIINGLFRYFYSTISGKEFNKHFALENSFSGSLRTFVLNKPVEFSIQALEKTETLALPNKVLTESFNRHICWERIGRLYAQQLALTKELREKEFLLDPLEVRYQSFLKEFPNLINRIPHYHIASYLGVTNVALSRIRKKIGY